MRLVCFAVKEEAKAFQKMADAIPNVEVLVTGIGKQNAARAIRAAITRRRPGLVVSSGFAGGLRPELVTGDIVYDLDPGAELESALNASGAKRGRFQCVDRIATTAREKRALREQSGADAVEMESEIIRAACREEGISAATIRVVLDTADQDLALDFNEFMNSEQELDTAKLAWAVARSPGKVGALLRLQRESKEAAEKLARVLADALGVRA